MTRSRNRKHDVAALLAWYGANKRDLPWRRSSGAAPDPYRVWLSEIMLQQTTVAAVAPYFERFAARWPDFAALAAAPLEDVMRAWAGLGYYSRARNMHRCAEIVARQLGGKLPADCEQLQKLPGVGPYTAAAVAAIAFGRPAVVVDGNVERVVCRLFAIDAPPRAAKHEIRAATELLSARQSPGDFAQAMMELGATVCAPRRPACDRCPLALGCRARERGATDAFPVKAARKPRPLRRGAVYYLRNEAGEVLVRTRPPRGLFGGMSEFPGTQWTSKAPRRGQDAPAAANWRRAPGLLAHAFTHFHLELAVYVAEVAVGAPILASNARWTPESRLDEEALPSLMRKVAALAQKSLTRSSIRPVASKRLSTASNARAAPGAPAGARTAVGKT